MKAAKAVRMLRRRGWSEEDIRAEARYRAWYALTVFRYRKHGDLGAYIFNRVRWGLMDALRQEITGRESGGWKPDQLTEEDMDSLGARNEVQAQELDWDELMQDMRTLMASMQVAVDRLYKWRKSGTGRKVRRKPPKQTKSGHRIYK